MSTVIEIKDDNIYLSTDDRKELLELIQFIVRNYARLEERKQYSVTLYEMKEMREG
jgi:hypothetical protein